MKRPYKMRPIRIHMTTSYSGHMTEKSLLIYFGKRPWLVLGLHKKKAYFVRERWFEITRYPKITEE